MFFPKLPISFRCALKEYEKKTKKDLLAHPLAVQLQNCYSTTAILAILQDQVQEFDQHRRDGQRLTKWLNPTVNVLYALSATLSEGVGIEMTNIIVKIMTEVLSILAIATKEVKQSRASELVGQRHMTIDYIYLEKYVKKLVGRNDIEDALKRLDKLTQDEARMAIAETLKITHNVETK
ncbi:hypothetical protein BGW80DRAFT_1281762 [Lactifluus volemus]|nr:hypothetical protein BGW80DRAFT_1281762 [Lactifluus volemus]